MYLSRSLLSFLMARYCWYYSFRCCISLGRWNVRMNYFSVVLGAVHDCSIRLVSRSILIHSESPHSLPLYTISMTPCLHFCEFRPWPTIFHNVLISFDVTPLHIESIQFWNQWFEFLIGFLFSQYLSYCANSFTFWIHHFQQFIHLRELLHWSF